MFLWRTFHCPVGFKTANFYGAGTSAQLSMKLNGSQSSGFIKDFNGPDDDFEHGSFDVFKILSDFDLGDIKSIEITNHMNNDDNPEWFLEWAVIHDDVNDRLWTFPLRNWIGGGGMAESVTINHSKMEDSFLSQIAHYAINPYHVTRNLKQRTIKQLVHS
ncbi:PLAT/LH2 domain-containing protein [Cohnella fermenti]|uniref:PLAT domain-containing protein n=1 Tax=Cohnella fermenti TaxID=2565925 RepID=A0A4S4BM23_9BACL|nr:PLAT/LH2 domain-containing protein [Cohnella fermenti]THF75770.1 hypothetical protein E6C55_21190 [Cohnella fermenti]